MPRASLARRFATLSLALAATAAMAACAPAAPAPPPAELSASVLQGRLDVEAHRLVIRVENTGDDDVVVEQLELDAPTFTESMVRDDPFELDPGQALAVRLDLPEIVCGAASDRPAELKLEVSSSDRSDALTLTPDDPFDTLARVADADCLAASVGAVAAIVMPEHLRSTGTGADRRAFVDVLIDPEASADGSFHLDRVSSTTLLSAEGGTDWPFDLEIAAGDPAQTISLPVRPARCDAHALADDKRGTILPFEIRTSDGRAGLLDRSSGMTLKAELYAYYTERCGL